MALKRIKPVFVVTCIRPRKYERVCDLAFLKNNVHDGKKVTLPSDLILVLGIQYQINNTSLCWSETIIVFSQQKFMLNNT